MSHIMSFEGDKGLSQVELEENVEILVAAGRCVLVQLTSSTDFDLI